MEAWEIHLKEHDCKCWTDPTKCNKISMPEKTHTHILKGSPDKRERVFHFFKRLPGATISVMPKYQGKI